MESSGVESSRVESSLYLNIVTANYSVFDMRRLNSYTYVSRTENTKNKQSKLGSAGLGDLHRGINHEQEPSLWKKMLLQLGEGRGGNSDVALGWLLYELSGTAPTSPTIVGER